MNSFVNELRKILYSPHLELNENVVTREWKDLDVFVSNLNCFPRRNVEKGGGKKTTADKGSVR